MLLIFYRFPIKGDGLEAEALQMHQEWFKLPKPLPALLVKCHERCPRVDNSVCSVQSRPPSPSLHRSLFFFTYIAEHKQLTSINVFQVSCSYYVGGCKLQLLVSKGQTIWTLACSALSVTTSAKQKGNSLCISHPFNFPNYLTTGNFHDLKKNIFQLNTNTQICTSATR